MRNTIKALLFSLLLFPGTGHFVLGKVRRGLLFFLPALVGAVYLVNATIEQAEILAEQMLNGGTPQISETVAMGNASWMLLACWLLAAIDAFFLGRKADHNASAGNKPE